MGFLRADDFVFNGQKLSEFGFRVVEINQTEATQSFGLNRSIETVEAIGGERNINRVTQNSEAQTVTIAKLDENNNVMNISEEEMTELNRWLFSPTNFKELITLVDDEENLLYYVIFTSSDYTYYGEGHGYLTLTFELDGNHAYGITEETSVVVETSASATVYIDLKDNISTYYYPDIEFSVTGDSFSISNDTIGETIEFTGLSSQSYRSGRIYGEGLMFVVSESDSTLNMREKSNKKFLRLKYGRNKLTFKGNGSYKIYVQPKIALQ